MFVLGFQSLVLLLDGCVLALAEKVGDAGLYAVRILPVNLSRTFLLFGDFAVKFLAAPLLLLVPDLEFFMFGFGIVRLTDRGIPVGFGYFLFRLYLFGFLLLLGRCSFPVSSFELPLSMSRHSAKSVCISLMAFSSSLQDFPVSWFIQSHTIWA